MTIPEGYALGEFVLSAAAAATGIIVAAATAAGIAGKCKNYEDRNDHPDKALVVIEKTAKAIVIHGIPPKSFY